VQTTLQYSFKVVYQVEIQLLRVYVRQSSEICRCMYCPVNGSGLSECVLNRQAVSDICEDWNLVSDLETCTSEEWCVCVFLFIF
jgi:hypothetical protein